MIAQPSTSSATFAVEHARHNETGTTFQPVARVYLLPALKSSGLLARLSGREARILLATLACLTPNGDIRINAYLLGRILRVPTPIAALWLRSFERARFRKRPIVHAIRQPSSITVYTLDRGLVMQDIHPPTPFTSPIPHAFSREAVRSFTRANYARPLEQVERMVYEQMGFFPEERSGTPEASVWRELRYLKLEREDIQALIDAYGVERILRHIAQMPDHGSKDRAKTLIEAIIKDAEPPKRLRDVLPKPNSRKEEDA